MACECCMKGEKSDSRVMYKGDFTLANLLCAKLSRLPRERKTLFWSLWRKQSKFSNYRLRFLHCFALSKCFRKLWISAQKEHLQSWKHGMQLTEQVSLCFYCEWQELEKMCSLLCRKHWLSLKRFIYILRKTLQRRYERSNSGARHSAKSMQNLR